MILLTEQKKNELIQAEVRSWELISKCLENFKNPRKNYVWGAIISSFFYPHLDIALKRYFVDHDIPGFKQHAYLCTLTMLTAKNKGYGNDELSSVLILFALLSDSEKAIQGVGLANPRYIRAAGNQPQSPYFWLHMYQLVMLNQMDEVAQRLEKAKTQVKKKERKELIEGRDFFSLLLTKDKPGLENLLLGKANNSPSALAPLDGLFVILPTIEAKLCWLHGIQVKINHPLVPMELMPIRPLPHYDDVYDFLNPGWVPPQQNLLAKINKWFNS